jgi:hypothetical protein
MGTTSATLAGQHEATRRIIIYHVIQMRPPKKYSFPSEVLASYRFLETPFTTYYHVCWTIFRKFCSYRYLAMTMSISKTHDNDANENHGIGTTLFVLQTQKQNRNSDTTPTINNPF